RMTAKGNAPSHARPGTSGTLELSNLLRFVPRTSEEAIPTLIARVRDLVDQSPLVPPLAPGRMPNAIRWLVSSLHRLADTHPCRHDPGSSEQMATSTKATCVGRAWMKEKGNEQIVVEWARCCRAGGCDGGGAPGAE